MAIDPKKIEEWKRLAAFFAEEPNAEPPPIRNGWSVHGDGWYETEALPDMAEAFPALLSERESLLSLLREVGAPGVLTCDEQHDFVSAPREGCGCRSCALAGRLAAFLR